MATVGEMVMGKFPVFVPPETAKKIAPGAKFVEDILNRLGIWDAEVLEWRVCEDFPVCGHPIKGGAKSVRVIVLKEE